MKRLLSMIGAITLIGTANINIVACDNKGEKPNPPIPISKYKFVELSKLNTSIWSSVSYDNIIYIGTNDGVYQNSVDNSNKFSKIQGSENSRITSLTTDKDGNVYASGQSGKIYKKQKDQGEFQLIKTFDNIDIWSIVIDKNGTIYASSDGNIHKKENDKDWQEIEINGSKYMRSFVFDNKGIIYASNENGNVYKSTDGVAFTAMSGTQGLIYTLAFDSKNNTIYAGSKIGEGKGVLYKSTGGENFKKIKEIKGEIHSLTINNDGILFIGTRLSRSVGTIYSYNHSEQFEEIKGIQGEVFTLTKSNDNNIYAGTWREDKTGSVYKLVY